MVTVIVDGQKHDLTGRVADIVRWLIKSADRIGHGATGVRFIFRGPTLKAIVENEETING